MNFYNSILSFTGFPIRQAKNEIRSIVNLSESEFNIYKKRKREEIFNFHTRNNPYYQKLIGDARIHSWMDIPIIEKKMLQVPLEDIVTPSLKKDKLFRNNTSGSTGVPFHFAKDKFAHAMTWAHVMDKYRRIGIQYGEDLQARFFGIPLSKNKYLKEKIKDFFSARVRFPIFNLSDDVLEIYFQQFLKYRFRYIYGYTSSLVLFAKYLQSKNIVLSERCPSLMLTIVTSEVCSVEDKILLQDVFGVPVVNEYGAAELDVLAIEDNEGRWVLNEETLFVEVVNENGEEVNAGQEGDVVVTSLYNRAMPFIRYRLGDRAILKNETINGRRIVEKITGRINDVAILPSGRKAPGLTFYYVSKGLLEESGVIKEFIIKQLKPTQFHFEYVAQSDLTEFQKKQVQELLNKYLEPGLTATFERKSLIERSGAGKFKHFQYLVV
jgi:phenylacetate-CoA ligase